MFFKKLFWNQNHVKIVLSRDNKELFVQRFV